MVLNAWGEAGLSAAARAVERPGGTAVVMPADAAAVFAVPDRIEDEVGPVDVWINVAFTSVFAPFDHIEPADYRRVTEVSYLGYVYATMATLKHMKQRNRGTIVQVGFTPAYRGIPLQSAYCGANMLFMGSMRRCAVSCCTRGAMCCSIATWAVPASTPSRPISPAVATPRPTCGRRTSRTWNHPVHRGRRAGPGSSRHGGCHASDPCAPWTSTTAGPR